MVHHRRATWSLLRSLRLDSPLPWVCGGDFNEILVQSELDSRTRRPDRQLADFRAALLHCGLSDLGFSGSKFTWTNRRAFPATVRARLDRFCASTTWKADYPTASVCYLQTLYSDHLPVLLSLRGQSPTYHRRRPLRYEAWWDRFQEIGAFISKAWGGISDSVPHLSWGRAVRDCLSSLSGWSWQRFGRIPLQIKRLERDILLLRRAPITEASKLQEASLRAVLEALIHSEDTKWKQRGKAAWLDKGDRNTKYFHARASARRKKNYIEWLSDGEGNRVDSRVGIQRLICSYFRELFQSTAPSGVDLEDVILDGTWVVNEEMHATLCRPFTPAEVSSALFSMSPLKSPGPDGLPPIFFQKFWPIVGTKVFSRASGLAINLHKSRVVFSRATPEVVAEDITAILGVDRCARHELYLGVPAAVGRSRHRCFAYIMDRVWKRIQGWKVRFLSQAGREILIKAVLTAIPTFVMSCFRLPRRFVVKLESLVSSFWWDGGGRRGLRWKSWRSLCEAKAAGGMSFRCFEAFNSALLAKQAWRLITRPDSLVAQLFRARYYPHGDFFVAALGDRPSYCWRSFFGVRALIVEGSRRFVGSGAHIDIWHDRWIPRPTSFMIQTPRPHDGGLQFVCELLRPGYREWDLGVIQDTFNVDDAAAILSIPLGRCVEPDSWVWHYSPNGIFSVRSAYRLAWKPPAQGFIKINFDGAVRSGPPMVGAGVIARDSSGGCLDWRSAVQCHMDNPLVAEALAARLAIEMAVTNGWTSVVVEGDCATVIHHLATLTVPFSLDRPIIRDALALARSIPTIEFVFARRSCNRVAHAIASASFLGPRSLPDSVLDLIQKDLANE
ncbi:hypothetical protein KSP39_PZI004212 [Platanthera zijinensis]|uniref:RNase H type-1 domain-containing protein n=1 Tax=Platanthera zijinensis TaxID=2320716 RepID=A0AAP0BZ63_9ASPA